MASLAGMRSAQAEVKRMLRSATKQERKLRNEDSGNSGDMADLLDAMDNVKKQLFSALEEDVEMDDYGFSDSPKDQGWFGYGVGGNSVKNLSYHNEEGEEDQNQQDDLMSSVKASIRSKSAPSRTLPSPTPMPPTPAAEQYPTRKKQGKTVVAPRGRATNKVRVIQDCCRKCCTEQFETIPRDVTGRAQYMSQVFSSHEKAMAKLKEGDKKAALSDLQNTIAFAKGLRQGKAQPKKRPSVDTHEKENIQIGDAAPAPVHGSTYHDRVRSWKWMDRTSGIEREKNRRAWESGGDDAPKRPKGVVSWPKETHPRLAEVIHTMHHMVSKVEKMQQERSELKKEINLLKRAVKALADENSELHAENNKLAQAQDRWDKFKHLIDIQHSRVGNLVSKRSFLPKGPIIHQFEDANVEDEVIHEIEKENSQADHVTTKPNISVDVPRLPFFGKANMTKKEMVQAYEEWLQQNSSPVRARQASPVMPSRTHVNALSPSKVGMGVDDRQQTQASQTSPQARLALGVETAVTKFAENSHEIMTPEVRRQLEVMLENAEACISSCEGSSTGTDDARIPIDGLSQRLGSSSSSRASNSAGGSKETSPRSSFREEMKRTLRALDRYQHKLVQVRSLSRSPEPVSRGSMDTIGMGDHSTPVGRDGGRARRKANLLQKTVDELTTQLGDAFEREQNLRGQLESVAKRNTELSTTVANLAQLTPTRPLGGSSKSSQPGRLTSL